MNAPKDKPTIDDLLDKFGVAILELLGKDRESKRLGIIEEKKKAKAALLSLLEGEAVTLNDYQEGSGYASRPAIPLSVVRELLKP